jgi:hypothetical protein
MIVCYLRHESEFLALELLTCVRRLFCSKFDRDTINLDNRCSCEFVHFTFRIQQIICYILKDLHFCFGTGCVFVLALDLRIWSHTKRVS